MSNDKTNVFQPLKYPNEPSRFGRNDLNDFIIWAVNNETSDITIQNEEQIICEIHGRMHRVTNRRLTRTEVMEIIVEIYQSDGAISQLNSGKEIDGPWYIRTSRSETLRFRINITSILADSHNGYSITIRTIKNTPPELKDLNLPQNILDNLSHPQGIILIAGGTGSGKSTFLASIIADKLKKDDSHLKILTYEAPIEYVYDDIEKPTSIISQTEIYHHLPNFTAGIRNALRRKPSIILVGEMRDAETIGEGITAASTGHLLFGTVHSNGVAETIRRMVNVFPSEERNSRAMDILTSIKLIIAQRLLPSTDGKRVAIREYLVFNQEIVDKLIDIEPSKLTYETRKLVLQYGQTFEQDAQAKYNEGLITEKILHEIKKSTKSSSKDILQEKENDSKISNFNDWDQFLNLWLKYGESFLEQAQKKYEQGLISKKELTEIRKITAKNIKYMVRKNSDDEKNHENSNNDNWEDL